MEAEGSLPHSQEPSFVPVLSQIDPVHAVTSHFSKIHFNTNHRVATWLSFYGEELLAHRPTFKLEDRPLSAVSDCFIQYIRSCALYLEADPPFVK